MSTRPRIPYLTLGLLAGLLGFAMAPDSLREACILDRNSTGLAHLWQLWSAHLVHWNTAHLVLNLLAGALAFTCLEWSSRTLWVRVVALSAPLISALTLHSYAEMQCYGGLSGLIYAALGALIIRAFQGKRAGLGVLLLLLLSLKLALEYLHPGPWSLDEAPAFVVARAAHWTGLACGALLAAIAKPRSTALPEASVHRNLEQSPQQRSRGDTLPASSPPTHFSHTG